MKMTLKLDLTPELETRLKTEAARAGLSPTDYALRVLDTAVPADPMPTNGAELVAYWEREGVLGSRPDIKDSLKHARAIRRKAEQRERS
jgi:hypothetical protein